MNTLFCIKCNARTPRNFADERFYNGVYCERCATEWERTPGFKKTPKEHIDIGLEVKRCEQCDYKREFERLMSLPNCNDCKHRTSNACGHAPRIGETVRINCPLWEPEKEGKG